MSSGPRSGGRLDLLRRSAPRRAGPHTRRRRRCRITGSGPGRITCASSCASSRQLVVEVGCASSGLIAMCSPSANARACTTFIASSAPAPLCSRQHRGRIPVAGPSPRGPRGSEGCRTEPTDQGRRAGGWRARQAGQRRASRVREGVPGAVLAGVRASEVSRSATCSACTSSASVVRLTRSIGFRERAAVFPHRPPGRLGERNQPPSRRLGRASPPVCHSRAELAALASPRAPARIESPAAA